ncbi:23S rRNA (pseudouridine(1915)-N(3))-methyltransferase RlmH [Thermaerobacter sp. FW80]|uniref:23S rRNA (pseudouridine(1915)-N(3))-methyltransferase RlmH n=1 Tax=Thermaerobacter sp. FW80 TaxID=2546351 RepID=UPI00107524BF|nr:23S rRNA (pseudouridine(1915)-N(3))-methyltransferase RlmH [Thermaerobacter sp. FW80]QBS37071.1 23S rRNA (pseudouridine(1915)-N(3))-methyltransferase RlmH [Thermaerobacter sp. FW80]
MPVSIELLAVGELDQPALRRAAEEYARRLGRYARVSQRRVPGEPVPARLTPAEVSRVLEVEARRLLDALAPGAYVVALDRRGRTLTSEDVAEWLDRRMVGGDSRLVFVIGGPLGLAPTVLERARERWSLSHLTFPHQMVPVILLEQLYRAFRILRGEPYHY